LIGKRGSPDAIERARRDGRDVVVVDTADDFARALVAG